MLDSDDMIAPDFISTHLQEFEQYHDADLVYCDDYLIDENDKPIRVIERPEYSDRKIFIRDLFRYGFPIVPFRTCIRRSVFDMIGLYDEELVVGEDYDMIRRFAKKGLKTHHHKRPLYLRRLIKSSLSKTYTARKAKSHFEVVKRFADTFAHDELFPDINWEAMPPERKSVNAKCLTAKTYLAIGHSYIEADTSSVYAETAFDHAYNELNECLEIDPDNHLVQELIEKYEGYRRSFRELVQQKT